MRLMRPRLDRCKTKNKTKTLRPKAKTESKTLKLSLETSRYQDLSLEDYILYYAVTVAVQTCVIWGTEARALTQPPGTTTHCVLTWGRTAYGPVIYNKQAVGGRPPP